MTDDLKGRKALITGASKGIGLAISEELASLGVKVLMVARNQETLTVAVEKIRKAGGDAVGFAADVSALDFLQSIRKKVDSELEHVDILVNNASGPPMARLLETTSEIWSTAIQTHLVSVIQLTKEFLPGMRDRKFGRILTVSSSIALEPTPEMVVSATVRAGISSLSKAIGTEFASFNVTANVICPGGVQTERMENLVRARSERESRPYADVLRESEANIPAKRFAKPSELAALASFLCSENAGYITGQSIVIDGGLTKSY